MGTTINLQDSRNFRIQLSEFAAYNFLYTERVRGHEKMQWYVVASLLTILTSSQGILTTLSQSNGGYKYDYATVPFLAEVLKLIVSSVLLWRDCQKSPPPKMTTEWKSIMGNLKIVTTGILFRMFLKRKLSNLQWMAIILLAVGTTTSQVKGCGETTCDSLFSAPIQGYMLGILSACLSALAGVYTEFLMKKNNDSLYWQNVQLYTFGTIFNMARLVLDDFRSGFEKGPWWQRLFNGYSVTTWMVISNLGSTGLLVSWLMKYAGQYCKGIFHIHGNVTDYGTCLCSFSLSSQHFSSFWEFLSA
ncbi:CMP-sialic acid transporter 1 [Forsythia ovata]|uniref:CMP-sialic acid transporter 1 n=1 Tax=Forsythia ovata TaxID=205694 RepID=A0ABD1QR84_9LAMI